MVRGKCIFLNVEDIIAAIVEIKNFIEEKNAAGTAVYHLTEIESRFTKKVPISDVTLKIAINEEIVSELQLTLQTNFAAYNFAHKVYELARSKVFSKVKITHNYFEEFQKDFLELVQRSIEIGASSQINKELLRTFFSLDGVKTKTLETVMESVLSNKLSGKDKTVLSVSVNKKMKDFIIPIFTRGLGKWSKKVGELMNQACNKSEHSKQFKSTILYFFLKDLDVSKEYFAIH